MPEVAFETLRKSRNEIVADLTSGQTENAKKHIHEREKWLWRVLTMN